MAIATKHATRFLVGADLVREKHHSELAQDHVKASRLERQVLCIREAKRDSFGFYRVRCVGKHRGINVRGDDLRLRRHPMHRPSNNTGTSRSLENAAWMENSAALRHELCVRFEQKRAHVAVVKCRSR